MIALCEFVLMSCTIYLDWFFSGILVLRDLKEKTFCNRNCPKNSIARKVKDKIYDDKVDRGFCRLIVPEDKEAARTT